MGSMQYGVWALKLKSLKKSLFPFNLFWSDIAHPTFPFFLKKCGVRTTILYWSLHLIKDLEEETTSEALWKKIVSHGVVYKDNSKSDENYQIHDHKWEWGPLPGRMIL